ncbi:hypothetical protein [Clostridium acetobutylicum]|uniref:Predicted membrane protein n=1 Tax=Clostridium acetobutylicum (strain ATCC 824 / DSM 792 / JCM 1419 / IAM 19013 / LMG 5710 / NBRC 13948 / NRRL B-527 / VKM B-1787 / 2291 / W) TaxID=272562 RepID=Q97KL5_CLOAB|nr:hypothetical protein [Clostridium acetobutylicum]AAK78878.1 Predicted membrane protein [Clostridium acetobutylicum ATCC 824]ADZ19953.1 membrane protein [Clostridium acetobutylicum EA 2018]PSM06400.1 hypothetical protein C7T89_10905 [Clostridium sp. NJ4]AEI31495.1 hypothetical protein SMB_G0919 [Clostridium acetobutylicum DSM 1731]AWV80597.1 hypothetical protein DK921_10910 [Clostridium acetobutylicum]
MVSGVYTRNVSREVKNPKKRKHIFYRYISQNIFLIISLVIFVVLVIGITFSIVANNTGTKKVFGEIGFEFTILGILIGCFMSIFGSIWYKKKIRMIQDNEHIRNYSRIIKADIERTSRLFENKRFTFIKISSVTILKNWIEAFSSISSKLTRDELQQLFDYYCQIDKLLDYEVRINKHLEVMQCSALKDYPYMKEYNELIKSFTIEVNILFKIDTTSLKKKLKLLCS